MSSKEIEIGSAIVRANRNSYLGTLGYELYIPSEMGNHVYDCLIEKGKSFGLLDGGCYAIDSLRLEKGHRFFYFNLLLIIIRNIYEVFFIYFNFFFIYLIIINYFN